MNSKQIQTFYPDIVRDSDNKYYLCWQEYGFAIYSRVRYADTNTGRYYYDVKFYDIGSLVFSEDTYSPSPLVTVNYNNIEQLSIYQVEDLVSWLVLEPIEFGKEWIDKYPDWHIWANTNRRDALAMLWLKEETL